MVTTNTGALIVILCENYYEATKLFLKWIDFCVLSEPKYIVEINKHMLATDCDDNTRYIFIDYRYAEVFYNYADVMLTEDEFLGLEDIDR